MASWRAWASGAAGGISLIAAGISGVMAPCRGCPQGGALIPGCQAASVFCDPGREWRCMYGLCYPDGAFLKEQIGVLARFPVPIVTGI